jgi:hypothetical protein
MRRLLPVLLAPIVLFVAVVPATAATDAAHVAGSALAQYRAAVNDAKQQQSVQWVLQYTGAFHELLTTTDGVQSGSQAMLVTSKGQSGFANEMLLPNGTAYLKGTALGLRDGVGLTASSASASAGTWWAFTKSTANYQQVADGLTVPYTVKDLAYSVSPKQPHISFGTPTGLGGQGLSGPQRVLVIKNIATGVLGNETLYISEGDTPLPLELKIPKLHETYTYTWGDKAIAPTAPAPSKSGSSLTFVEG